MIDSIYSELDYLHSTNILSSTFIKRDSIFATLPFIEDLIFAYACRINLHCQKRKKNVERRQKE